MAFGMVFLVISCDKNFDEINTNNVDPTSDSVDPIFLLNNAIINTSFSNAQLIYDLGVVQQIVSPNSGVLTGANYNQDNRDVTDDHWVKYYENVIKNTGDIMGQLQAEEAPERPNLLQMTRLIQAMTFMILTDEYGDVPYSEAGKGISDQIVLPAYDAQEAIYTDLINEVKEATAALSESAPSENGEVLYLNDLRFGTLSGWEEGGTFVFSYEIKEEEGKWVVKERKKRLEQPPSQIFGNLWSRVCGNY